MIGAQFGDAVARIVRACTDGTAEGKGAHGTPEAKRADWLRRKQDYLGHLARADNDVLLVSGCDKLHNALAILRDLENPDVGVQVFDRFTAGRDGTLRYYESLSRILAAGGSAIARRLDAVVARLHALTGAVREPLEEPIGGESDDQRISLRFWFLHDSGVRLYPYRLRDNRSGRVAFRVAPGATGANKVVNQTQLDDVEAVYQHVFGKGWSVRMRSLDGGVEGLYNRDGYSIKGTSEA
jgi:hypothetical protein